MVFYVVHKFVVHNVVNRYRERLISKEYDLEKDSGNVFKIDSFRHSSGKRMTP